MKSLKGNDGFSLIELIVAIGVLAITGTTIFIGFTNSARIHSKTSTLQMAEDVGQYVAEEFKSHSVDWLVSNYTGSINKDAAGAVTSIEFTNVPFTYSARSAASESQFTANITMTPVSDASKPGLGTTYKQNQDVTYFYEVDPSVGTNTFIVPEVTNIYDGTCVVVSEDINQYDSRVVNDLYQVIKNDIEKKNSLIPLAANQINVADMDSKFSEKYIPLTNITNENQLVKTTDIRIEADTTGDDVTYSYVVTVSFTFNFDFELVYGNGNSAGSLKDVVSSGELSAVDGATSTYEVKHSGSKYTVTYEETLPEEMTGQSGLKGSFGGILNVDSDLSTDDMEPKYTYKKDGSGDKVAYLYILYTPFDMYSDKSGGVANDKITFDYSGSGATNIVRTFLVTQEVASLYNPSVTMTVEDCEYDGNKDIFKLYTNSKEIIEKSSDITGKEYLTNSYGKTNVNSYELKIELFDLDGNKRAEINTVKED